MSKGKKICLIIVGILLALAVAAGGYYFFFYNNPKNVLKNILNRSYNSVDKAISEAGNYIDPKSDKLSVSGNLSLDTGAEDIFSKYNYDFNINLDKAQKKAAVDLGVNKKSTSVLKATIAADDKKMYLSAPDVYSKTIEVSDIEDFWNMFIETTDAISDEDFLYIARFFKDNFLNEISNDDFTTKSSEITINSEKIKAKQYQLKLDEKRLKEISINIINNIDKDSKAKKILANLVSLDEKDIISELKSEVDDIDVDEDLIINIYTKNFSTKVIRTAVVSENKEVFIVDNYNDEVNITINNFDEKSIFINYKKEDKKSTIKVKMGNIEIATITVNEKDNGFKLDIVVTLGFQSIKGSLDIAIKNEAKLPVINTTNTISIDDMSEADMNSIYSKIQSNEFIKDVTSMLSFLYDYDY